jgi:hypothetical protein
MKFEKYWFHLQKKNFLLQIFTFKDYLYLKTEFRAKKNSVCHAALPACNGVAVGFWTKFEAQLAQLVKC